MDYKDVIKSIGYSQHEILYNIMQLHNGGESFDCDMTYSVGNFYGKFNVVGSHGERIKFEIPQPKYKLDVCPQYDDVIKIEPLGNLPFADASIKSIVIDLPFVISSGPSINAEDEIRDGKLIKKNIISKRFAYFYPVSQLLAAYKHWIEMAYRVLSEDGLLILKTQPTITGGKFLNTPYYSRMIAHSVGFDDLDEFVLLAKNRLISGKVKKQQHARSFHSYFFVFKKSLRKKIPYFDFMSDKEINALLEGLRKNNLKKDKR